MKTILFWNVNILNVLLLECVGTDPEVCWSRLGGEVITIPDTGI